jgi:hypothetical protein
MARLFRKVGACTRVHRVASSNTARLFSFAHAVDQFRMGLEVGLQPAGDDLAGGAPRRRGGL